MRNTSGVGGRILLAVMPGLLVRACRDRLDRHEEIVRQHRDQERED